MYLNYVFKTMYLDYLFRLCIQTMYLDYVICI